MASGAKTNTSGFVGLLVTVGVLVALVVGYNMFFTNPEGPSELPPMPEDDNQVFVDIAAIWTPRRNIHASFQVGAAIHGPERFTAEDPGRFGIRIVVDRGTEIVFLVEEGTDSPGGGITCEIRVNDREQVVEDSVGGRDSCRVELVT